MVQADLSAPRDPPTAEPPRTDPAACVVTGDVNSCTTRSSAHIYIEAHDARGEPRKEGGDVFLVSIRGRGESVRAKVYDEEDGTYTVRYVPITSGKYLISVTLRGVPLPGSPYTCVASTPTASAPHCIVRGAALLSATARKEEHFEVQFKDPQGAAAHAEELDVYVATVSKEELDELVAVTARERQEEAAALEEEKIHVDMRYPTKKDAAKAKEKAEAKTVEEEDYRSPFHVSKKHSQRAAGAEGLVPLLKTHECTVTSSKPLVLRAGLELDSARLGQLQPGQKLKLLEVVMVDEGDGKQSARASVALSDEAQAPEPDLPYLHTWRETFTVRPLWLDGVSTPRSSRSSAPPSSRATDRSVSPFPSSRNSSPFSYFPFGRPRSPPGSPPRPRSFSPPASPAKEVAKDGVTPIGWVTVHKGKHELVTPRGTLKAGTRQKHMQQWARRIAVDKSVAVTATQPVKKQQAFGEGAQGTLGVRHKKRDKDASLMRDGQSVYKNEISSFDDLGIGFAFGGVDPGRLHARGQVHETHKVHYSIARTGTYRLHVGLRHDGVELPGSPFLLQVTAGPASALSTSLLEPSGHKWMRVGAERPRDGAELFHAKLAEALVKGMRFGKEQWQEFEIPMLSEHSFIRGADDAYYQPVVEQKDQLSGIVGEHGGCKIKLRTRDKMNNQCSSGGAAVTCYCKAQQTVETDIQDEGNGSYILSFHSKHSGNFAIHVAIDGIDVKGSPTQLRLISDTPDLSQTEASGEGLEQATAGKPAHYAIKCKDKYGNPADPGNSVIFEMALLKAVEATETKSASKAEKANIADRWKTAKPHEYEWSEKDGEYEISYVAEKAGNLELHVWSYHTLGQQRGHRIAVPSSPFSVHCEAGKAHPEGSRVDGFTRHEAVVEQRKGQAGSQGQAAGGKPSAGQTDAHKKRNPRRAHGPHATYQESNEIFAGDVISVRPLIRDRLDNNTAAPEGSLVVLLDMPDGGHMQLEPEKTIRGGLTNYDVRYEAQQGGHYQMRVLLNKAAIKGSPVHFECIPNLPDVGHSTYVLPTDTVHGTPALQKEKDYIITVVARDRCGNQLEHCGAEVAGRLQSANLPPQQEANLEVVPKDDGTYELKINLKAACELKVIISIDKDRQGEGGGEFPPIPMTFVNPEALKKKMAKAAKQESSGGSLLVTGVDESFLDDAMGDDSGGFLSPDNSKVMAFDSTGSAGSDGMPAGFSPGRRKSVAGKQRGGSFRQAGDTVVEGFGRPDERREKTAGMAVVAGMAMDAKADVAPASNPKRSIGSMSSLTSSVGSDGHGRGSIGSDSMSRTPTKVKNQSASFVSRKG